MLIDKERMSIDIKWLKIRIDADNGWNDWFPISIVRMPRNNISNKIIANWNKIKIEWY